jgi:putative DNA primase/helicase
MSRLDAQADALADRHRDTVAVRQASRIPMIAIRWLWSGWLALGKFHLIGGAPGTGKTTLALAMAATVTIAGRWPDGSKAPLGNVLIWSGEDDPADTLVPRLAAAGADLSRVFFVEGTTRAGEVRSFDPAHDLDLLAQEAAKIGEIALIVVDPVVSAVAGDSHKNTEVRRALQPLVEMADRLSAALLGVTHFSKGTAGRDPTERITGSVAFGALARVVMVAAKRGEGDKGAERMLARSKSNIGPDGGGFGYDLAMVPVRTGIEASVVRWGEVLTGSARELLGDAEGAPESARDEAGDWLRDMLATCPVRVQTLRDQAKAAGLAWRTVERAKKEAGVRVQRRSEGNDGAGAWVWSLPNTATARPPVPPQMLAVLPNPSNDAGSTDSKSARPPPPERQEAGGLAPEVRCLDCRHATLSTVNREGGLATCGAGHRAAVAAATHACSSFDGVPA